MTVPHRHGVRAVRPGVGWGDTAQAPGATMPDSSELELQVIVGNPQFSQVEEESSPEGAAMTVANPGPQTPHGGQAGEPVTPKHSSLCTHTLRVTEEGPRPQAPAAGPSCLLPKLTACSPGAGVGVHLSSPTDTRAWPRSPRTSNPCVLTPLLAPASSPLCTRLDRSCPRTFARLFPLPGTLFPQVNLE